MIGPKHILLESRSKGGQNLEGKSIYHNSMPSKRSPFVVGKPRVKSFSSKSQCRRPSVPTGKPEKPIKPSTGNNILKAYSTKAVKRDMPSTTARIPGKYINTSQTHNRKPSVRKNDTSDRKQRKVSFRSQAGDAPRIKARKQSVVSTKVKRYSTSSPIYHPDRYPRVKRGTHHESSLTSTSSFNSQTADSGPTTFLRIVQIKDQTAQNVQSDP